ncbi:MAG: hypothetical protein MUC38_07535 [Cyclobacteriaceae bacterium]|jgi:hypothetical protein|nr:hypothetical protein [Cyclobacteriaceae bacterium]
MNELVIDNKRYVLLEQNDFDTLRKKAALKRNPEKTLTVAQARAVSKRLIRKWANEK